jgi:hypothetical protein
MMIYRGELISGSAAVPRLLLRDLIHEKVLVGPVVAPFDGDVARVVKLPNGTGRIDYWKRGVGLSPDLTNRKAASRRPFQSVCCFVCSGDRLRLALSAPPVRDRRGEPTTSEIATPRHAKPVDQQ